MALNYLLSPTFQIVNTAGKPATGGYIEVYVSGDREKYYCASDFNGTLHPFRIPLDALGSNIVLAELGQAYDVYIYNRYGSLLMSRYNVQPSSGGGIRDIYRVISTDGSIEVDTHTFGNRTDFDIGIAPGNSDEFLEWVRCFNSGLETGPVYPAKVDGSMETDGEHGLHVGKDRFFHITSSFTVDPTAHGISYKTLTVALMFSDGEQATVLTTKKFDVDTSVEDPVIFEFAQDYKVPADGYIYWEIEADSDIGSITANMQAHRIYSGINAVPDTCATKQWVGENFQPQSGMSAYVPYSGLEYNGAGEISGISGSALAGGGGGTPQSAVSAIASAYAESAASSKMDASASSSFYPMTGNPSGFLTAHQSLSAYQEKSGMTAYLPASASGEFAPSGDYAYNSSLSSKLDASASSQFQPSGNYAPSGDYAFNSAVSAKLDASASGSFALASSLSAYVEKSSYSAFSSETVSSISSVSSVVSSVSANMSAYVPFSSISGEASVITAIAGSSLAGNGGHEYSGIAPVNVDNVNDTISVDHIPLCVDGSMTAYRSGDSAVIGVNASALDLSGKQDISGMSAYVPFSSIGVDGSGKVSGINGSGIAGTDEAVVSGIASAYAESAVSGKMDASASSNFYPSGNPSGFITGVDLSPYQPVSGMTAYQPASAMSAYQLSGDYYSGSNPSGFVDGAYVASGLSGKENTFSAGEGLEFVQSGSNRVLQVEAPVDIVAGPGIVIDNPDGNTLRVSVAQNMETVLWENASGATNNITLSEAIENFDSVKVEWCPYTEASNWTAPYDVVETKLSNGLLHLVGCGMSNDTNFQVTTNLLLSCSTTSVTVSKQSTILTNTSASSIQSLSGYKIYKIVGIHRIASN